MQVVFLTGQSDPPRCALSPVQRAFLDALPLPPSAKLAINFPYRADTPPWRNVSLLAASVNNARLYLASRQPEFAGRHAPEVLRLLARAPRTLIVAGSSGLELLANLRLPREALDRVHVFAYGPVARRLPDCACVLVQGRRDWVSRWWFRAVDHRVECTHLDYLESPEVLALCVQTLHRLTPRDTTPRETTPRETNPRETTLRETAPRKATPRETTSRETTLREATPREAAPCEPTVHELSLHEPRGAS